MFLIIKILFDIIIILYPIALAVLVWCWSRKLDKIGNQIKKANIDINTLHKNQQLLVSNLKVIQGNVRKHDKPKLRFSGEKTWPEESGEGRNDDKATGTV